MSDYLINLGKNKALKSLLGSIGISTPQPLKRQEGSWNEKSLAGKNIVTSYSANGLLQTVLPAIYSELGAGGDLSQSTGTTRYDGLIFDGTGIKTIAELEALYQFFHDEIKKLSRNGRVLIINRQPDNSQPEQVAAFQAMEGFMRSISKEVGRKSATANMIQLASNIPSGEIKARLQPILHFLLSNGAAFVDAQVIRMSSKVTLPDAVSLSKPLFGKIALVTGASRGIGEATARTLAREGAKVLIIDIPALAGDAQKVADQIGGTFLPLDVTQDDAPEKINEFIQKEVSGLDILVHNAGITRDKTIGNMDLAKWQQVLNVNLQSIIRINKEVALNEHGRMICLSSISGFAGNFGQTNYAATKAGIIGYVNGLSKELAAKNITVNAVAPGFIESDMTAKMPFMTREFARRLSNLSQGGIPQDIAEGIAFLASPGAVSITGETLRICGGSLIGA